MYGCETWTVKKAKCQKIDAFQLWFGEDSWESLGLQGDPLQIQPVHPEGDQSWVFNGRTDAEAETLTLWPPYGAGRDWGQEEKGMTEDETVGWHHRLDGHEFEQTPGVGDGQGGLACWDSWGHKESDTTERLDWTDGCCSSATKSGLILCDPMDCSPPGSSVHGVSQARTLERAAVSFSRGPSRPGKDPGLLLGRRILYCWATRAAPVSMISSV